MMISCVVHVSESVISSVLVFLGLHLHFRAIEFNFSLFSVAIFSFKLLSSLSPSFEYIFS